MDQRPRNGHALLLPAGQAAAPLLPHDGFQALRHMLQVSRQALSRSARSICASVNSSPKVIFSPNGRVKQKHILLNVAHLLLAAAPA